MTEEARKKARANYRKRQLEGPAGPRKRITELYIYRALEGKLRDAVKRLEAEYEREKSDV